MSNTYGHLIVTLLLLAEAATTEAFFRMASYQNRLYPGSKV